MLAAQASYFLALWPLSIYLTVVETRLPSYMSCWRAVKPTRKMAQGLVSLRDKVIRCNEEQIIKYSQLFQKSYQSSNFDLSVQYFNKTNFSSTDFCVPTL